MGLPSVQATGPVLLPVTGGGQPNGPAYTFYMSKYLITVGEYRRFLNDAEANQGNARGANMIFGASGNVGFGADPDDGLYRRSATGDLLYNSGAALGSRYTLSTPEIAQMPAHSVTWFGAMKYSNWLTLDQGLGEAQRAYHEGPDEFDWYPAHLTQAEWLDGFSDEEREGWLQVKGFRLPMDHLSVLASAYNEWFKAGAWNGIANAVYGWGRNTKTGPDGNYYDSGDPWENAPGAEYGYPARTPVGFYDGSLQLKADWNWPDAMETYQTNANDNAWGVYDMSGNLWKWTADTLYDGDFSEPDNRYIVVRGQAMRSGNPTLTIRNPQNPFDLGSQIGFHIVQVLQPPLLCEHLDIDLNGPDGIPDCYVDLYDFDSIANQWGQCTDPQLSGCVDLRIPGVLQALPKGTVTVNGDLSEWADAEWHQLDKIYYGDPCDIPDEPNNAMFALKWDGDTDKVYAAIVVNDTDHVFESTPSWWDTSDRVEVYAQGDPNGGIAWGASDPAKIYPFDKAQQYVLGPTGTDSEWAFFGNGTAIPGVNDPCLADFDYAASVGVTQIVYEVGAKMFIWFGGRSGEATVVRQLAHGGQVGFDIVVDTRYGSIPVSDPNYSDDFGMRSANTDTGKYHDALMFQKWILIDPALPPACGDWGYLGADVSGPSDVPDCAVDLFDLRELVSMWLHCTDPGNPDCDL